MKALSSILYLLSSAWLFAQPQEAWVMRYNGGFTNKNHTPLGLKLDTAGTIYVAGSSRNATNLSDYVVLKYAPSGAQLYATRYSSTHGANYAVSGFALDQNGNTYLTGTGETVKFNATGNVAWVATYAGNDVAADTNGDVYVTGFSSVQFTTVKLDAAGSNLWMRTYAAISGPGNPVAESQKLAVDGDGNVYVGGWADWAFFYDHGSPDPQYYSRPVLLKYNVAGGCLWTNDYTGGGQIWGSVQGIIPGGVGRVYVNGCEVGGSAYHVYKIQPNGSTTWGFSWGGGPPFRMALDGGGNAYLVGGQYLLYKLRSTDGQLAWYVYQTAGKAHDIALDSSTNIYVTGVTNAVSSNNDWETVKYDNAGHQLWVKRYNGPANGNDGATGIAVAPDGSIYVTGYSANESGGSDIVLIKYVMPATIQKKTGGSMQLQGYGLPSSNYTFQAGTNLLNWDPIGSSTADTNGLFQFTDTNAPSFPFRFYRWTLP